LLDKSQVFLWLGEDLASEFDNTEVVVLPIWTTEPTIEDADARVVGQEVRVRIDWIEASKRYTITAPGGSYRVPKECVLKGCKVISND
jgi:hypothetical protein